MHARPRPRATRRSLNPSALSGVSADPGPHLSALRPPPLESLDPYGDGFTAVRLKVTAREKFVARQSLFAGLDPDPSADDQELDMLFEQIRARLGEAAVMRPRLTASYVPERAWTAEAIRGTGLSPVKQRRAERPGSPCPEEGSVAPDAAAAVAFATVAL